jgi:glycosyltransferase involved in cell wall biosynthesis
VRALISELTYLPLLVREVADADVVHVFSRAYFWFLLAPLPAIAIGHILARPVVLHYHNGEASDHLRRSRVARAALARVNRIVVPSRYLAAVLAQYSLPTSIVSNVIDLERFSFRVRDPLRPRLLSTRNLHALYNVECTLRAFQIVQRRRPEASLTVLGGGSRERSLRVMAQALGLTNIRFVGRVPHDLMPRYYADHDLYIQTPNIDNMPNSVIEAFASGLAVVSTDAGGIPTMMTHGEHGLLAPVNDHEALARHVLRLLDEPETARRIVLAARRASETYAWSRIRGEWLPLYRNLAATAASRALWPSHEVG